MKISGGMKRRLDFAISLIHDPDILILDEPTTGLDPVIRKNIWDLILSINKQGKTIIVSSHLLDYIQSHCNKICLLNKGKTSVYSIRSLAKKYPRMGLNQVFVRLVKDV